MVVTWWIVAFCTVGPRTMSTQKDMKSLLYQDNFNACYMFVTISGVSVMMDLGCFYTPRAVVIDNNLPI